MPMSPPPPPPRPPWPSRKELIEMIKKVLSKLSEEEQIEFVIRDKEYFKFIDNPSEAVTNAYKIAHEL